MQTNHLESIKSPKDLKNFDESQLNELALEIRSNLIHHISQTGGHLASNLGTVELTIAIHKVFDCPKDQIVWDVGHQSYTHKILTGRLERFATLRQKDGIAGFPKQKESEYDSFVSGHSSTSVSVAYGLAEAKRLQGDESYVIAVVGDGACTGGMIYEGLNNAGRSGTNLIVILNDNEMSISENVGALSRYLAGIRNRQGYFQFKDRLSTFLPKIPLLGKPLLRFLTYLKKTMKSMLYRSTFFEDFGFEYLGPVDGHNIAALCSVLKRAKQLKRPTLIHAHTIKGKGYDFAEKDPEQYHGVSKFDIVTGESAPAKDSFTACFRDTMMEFAEQDERICAITAAMSTPTGLSAFSQKYPERFFDVGIAEAHAVTFSAALARNGMLPVVALYSTFLQRAYDQILHDASIEEQHIILAIDRAGVVGEDGETHQGVFDTAFLSHIPHMTIFSPSDYEDLRLCLKEALYQIQTPVAVRYPKGRQPKIPSEFCVPSCEWECFGNPNAEKLIVTYGRTFGAAAEVMKKLEQEFPGEYAFVKLVRISPLDQKLLQYCCRFEEIFFFEEGIRKGSIAEHLLLELSTCEFRGAFHIKAIEDSFVPHATVEETLHDLQLDESGIYDMIKQYRCGNNHNGE